MALAKYIIRKFSFATDVIGFNWLKVNYEEAIGALKRRDVKLMPDVTRYLWDAWINRDGAISVEISEFFETALKYNPSVIIDMFAKREKALIVWLEQLEHQMFTNWTGEDEKKLKSLKADILLSLEDYISTLKRGKKQALAKKIKERVSEVTIRNIS